MLAMTQRDVEESRAENAAVAQDRVTQKSRSEDLRMESGSWKQGSVSKSWRTTTWMTIVVWLGLVLVGSGSVQVAAAEASIGEWESFC